MCHMASILMRRFSRPTAVASFFFQQTSDHPTLLRDGHENNSQNYDLQRSEFPRASKLRLVSVGVKREIPIGSAPAENCSVREFGLSGALSIGRFVVSRWLSAADWGIWGLNGEIRSSRARRWVGRDDICDCDYSRCRKREDVNLCVM